MATELRDEVRMNGAWSRIEIVKGEVYLEIGYEELWRKSSGVFLEVL
ncbi:hypothetical protein ACFFH4_21500 [Halalkalibacter alkalisediminis]|uniref:Uncharacterized protein n=1 Tax=Halalkalibacter alkalisediminis TaxID=935616 RepID=A0ABV6NL38_9BACI